jgi:hypothetical protein
MVGDGIFIYPIQVPLVSHLEGAFLPRSTGLAHVRRPHPPVLDLDYSVANRARLLQPSSCHPSEVVEGLRRQVVEVSRIHVVATEPLRCVIHSSFLLGGG